MRIAWFTPFDAQSAIARYSRLIVETLAQHAEVELLLPAGTAQNELATSAAIARYELRSLVPLLAGYDVSIFNMGDSAYHSSVWEALCVASDAMHPAVVILHDAFYVDFFSSYTHATGGPRAFERLARDVCGSDGDTLVAALRVRDAPWSRIERFSLHEPIVARADACVVHSRFCATRLDIADRDRTLQLFIPVEFAHRLATVPASPPRGEGRPLILGYGVGNRNKCIHHVLEALAADRRLARDAQFCFAGAIADDYLGELTAYAARYHLDNVRFTGPVEDAVLAGLIDRAAVCVNLRQPCLEGGSASLVEMLARGKATVAYDDGVYREIPDDCIRKVPVNDAGELAAALRELLFDPERRSDLGARARSFVNSSWTAAQYIRRLLQFLEQHHRRWAVQVAARDAARSAASELRRIGLGMAPFGHAIADATARWGAGRA